MGVNKGFIRNALAPPPQTHRYAQQFGDHPIGMTEKEFEELRILQGRDADIEC